MNGQSGISLTRAPRRHHLQRGLTLVQFLVAVGVLLVVIYAIVDAMTCPGALGTCTSRECTSDSPCEVDFDGDGTAELCIAGKMCTNSGAICESNWVTADCKCETVPGQAQGSCRTVCIRP